MDYLLSLLGIILILPLTLFVIYGGKHLHKNENKYYVIVGLFALITGIYALVLQIQGTVLQNENPVLYALLFQGHLTFPFFILVMYGGAFKNKSKPKLTLMKVRRELAILGFLFLIPHAVYLVWTALTNLNPTGTIAFLIMLPLFITSFPKIRRKMKPKEWKKLHKWAYPAYAMIYIHIASITIIFNLMNNSGSDLIFGFVRFGLYTLIFGHYSYLKYVNRKPKPKPKEA